MHNKCSNKTEINCNAKQCFYEDYWKFMTRVHHDMIHNAWAMSIGELRTLKDEIIVLTVAEHIGRKNYETMLKTIAGLKDKKIKFVSIEMIKLLMILLRKILAFAQT